MQEDFLCRALFQSTFSVSDQALPALLEPTVIATGLMRTMRPNTLRNGESIRGVEGRFPKFREACVTGDSSVPRLVFWCTSIDDEE
jgi:hypothetical protein